MWSSQRWREGEGGSVRASLRTKYNTVGLGSRRMRLGAEAGPEPGGALPFSRYPIFGHA
jgi:hypothetical protein